MSPAASNVRKWYLYILATIFNKQIARDGEKKGKFHDKFVTRIFDNKPKKRFFNVRTLKLY